MISAIESHIYVKKAKKILCVFFSLFVQKMQCCNYEFFATQQLFLFNLSICQCYFFIASSNLCKKIFKDKIKQLKRYMYIHMYLEIGTRI